MLSLAIKSLVSGNKIYMALGIALIAMSGLSYYEYDRANGLETQVQLYKERAQSAQTIDELNKQTARSNETLLNNAIAKQNEMFDKLAAITNAQSQNVLDELNKSQASTAVQYSKVSQAIGKIQIASCEGLVDELIKFPQDPNLRWITR